MTKQRKPRKAKKVARRARHKAGNRRTRVRCKPQGNTEPPMPDRELVDQHLAQYRALGDNLLAKGRYIKTLPREFWLAIQRREFTKLGIKIATGIAEPVITRELIRHGITWDHSSANAPSRANTLAFAELVDWMGVSTPTFGVPMIDPDKTWGIFADPHFPTVSGKVWLPRFIRVCEREQVDGTVCMGDLMNQDAASKYARRYRGVMPSLQQEIDMTRPAVHLIGSLGPLKGMLTNHDLRVIFLLASELKATDWYKTYFPEGDWYDCRMLDIGPKPGPRLIHPDRGRKVEASQANEYSLRYEREVWLGHSHRELDIWSQAGRRCGGIPALVDFTKLAYYTNEPNYIECQNGFAIWKDHRMMLFGEHTDWSKYGCK